MKTLNLLAMDLGASNGRGIVGRFDGKKITLEEVHRFSNDYVDLNGVLYWDIMKLFMEIKSSLSKYAIANGRTLDSIGIDTWGVDYGLIDKNGQLLGNPHCYRNATDEKMNDLLANISSRELFDRTGTATCNFNTIFQLYSRKQKNDPALEKADKLLFTPDLLAYFLTGEMGAEYTMASTSMLQNPITKNWDFELISKLGIDKSIFPQISECSVLRGKILPAISEELGIGKVPFSVVGEHDTASAVAAVPATGEDFAFLSSGTWSLFGAEMTKPVFSDAVFNANYTNEGTIQGGIRMLANIMGLWLIQECRRGWAQRGENINYDEIVVMAQQSQEFGSIIDPDYPEFFAAGRMEEKIQNYCARTGQSVPQTKGEIARCIYESLALKYRWAVERLEEITGNKMRALHIVGGGIQNKLLNQFAANACGIPVITGPIEGACIGNLLSQAMALGEISNLQQLRCVVRSSFPVKHYLPNDQIKWEDAYGRLLKLMEIK